MMENHKPDDGNRSRSIINKGLADSIRAYINREIFQPTREAGIENIIVNSVDISSALKLSSRYPAICSAMEGTKIEKDYRVQILKRRDLLAQNSLLHMSCRLIRKKEFYQ